MTRGFGLKQHLDEDEYNERMRDKWRYQEAENRDKDSIHYGDVRFDGELSSASLIIVS